MHPLFLRSKNINWNLGTDFLFLLSEVKGPSKNVVCKINYYILASEHPICDISARTTHNNVVIMRNKHENLEDYWLNILDKIQKVSIGYSHAQFVHWSSLDPSILTSKPIFIFISNFR